MQKLYITEKIEIKLIIFEKCGVFNQFFDLNVKKKFDPNIKSWFNQKAELNAFDQNCKRSKKNPTETVLLEDAKWKQSQRLQMCQKLTPDMLRTFSFLSVCVHLCESGIWQECEMSFVVFINSLPKQNHSKSIFVCIKIKNFVKNTFTSVKIEDNLESAK